LKENGSVPTTSTTAKQEQTGMNFIWRIDAGCLRFEKKIASGPLSDLSVLSILLLDLFVDQYIFE